MDFFGQYGAQLVAAGLAILIAVAKWLLQARVKLVWGLSHSFIHNVDLEKRTEEEFEHVLVGTSYHLLSNTGRKAATDVEVTFNWVPKNFEVWPQRQFQQGVNPNGRFIVKFDSISPKEQLSLNMLTFSDRVPEILSVRSRETQGEFIPLTTNRQYSRWVALILLALVTLGLAACIYIIIQLVGWFANLSTVTP